jgi:Dipeptidyl aminopeptidases/acylaminoacyl-peptidases
MKRTVRVQTAFPGFWLDTDITFAHVPAWFGQATRSLKLSVMRHFLNQPAPLPCIVWVCGGAWLSMDRNIHLPNLVEFAREGFVIVGVEYRDSNEGKFPAQIEDIKAAIRFLRAHAANFQIDPDHIGIMGESAGGFLASLAGTSNGFEPFDRGDYLECSSDVQAVCSWYGPVDLSLQAKVSPAQDPFNGIAPEEQLLGSRIGRDARAAEEASPVTYISERSAPFLLLHGTEDTIVPKAHSEYLYSELERRGVPADLVLVEGAGHASLEFFQPQVKEIVIDFFSRYLKEGRPG